MTPNQLIGQNLRKYRERAEVCLAPFAEHLGIDVTTLIQIEDGHRALTAYQANRAGEYLRISVSELVKGEVK